MMSTTSHPQRWIFGSLLLLLALLLSGLFRFSQAYNLAQSSTAAPLPTPVATLIVRASGTVHTTRASHSPDPLVPASTTEATVQDEEAAANDRRWLTGALGVRDLPAPYTLRWRMGAAVPDGKPPIGYKWPVNYPGWYLNWTTGTKFDPAGGGTIPPLPRLRMPNEAQIGMEFVPMVRMRDGVLRPTSEDLTKIVPLLPNHVWLIGNEPDVRWQDNTTPEAYAHAYHLAYTAIKATDPAAQVAIAGLSQITPLRLAYLDRVWETYREEYGVEMPVDVWNMHAFILQEKADDWGVDMPPGFPSESDEIPDDRPEGMPWRIEDHNNLVLVEMQVQLMRRWMAHHGQRQKPLWITEYGILMPEEYGFPRKVVEEFMVGSFDLFEELRDPELGYSADGNRLIQRWMWFSTDDTIYPTGNLFTFTGEPTSLMEAIADYLASVK